MERVNDLQKEQTYYFKFLSLKAVIHGSDKRSVVTLEGQQIWTEA